MVKLLKETGEPGLFLYQDTMPSSWFADRRSFLPSPSTSPMVTP